MSWLTTELNDRYWRNTLQSSTGRGNRHQRLVKRCAVKWQAKNLNRNDVVGAITLRTLAGIRREGANRGHGQVDGLTWAEASRTLAGLRDSAMIHPMSNCLLRISEAVAVNV